MSLHVVVGHGPIGSTVAQQLAAAGEDVRVLTRTGGASTGRIEHLAVDATDAGALTAASRGAATIYNCANPPYHRWATDWPPLAGSLLAAAEATGAVYAITGNLYPYGPQSGPMTEATTDGAIDDKGRIRATLWRDAKALHDAGRIRAVEVRASDFYGPGVTSQGHFGGRGLPQLLSGKPITLLGNVDVPHSFTYVPDVARALIGAADNPLTWGHVWHVPTAAAGTQREMATAIAAAAGAPAARVRTAPWVALRAVGVVNPMLREIVKMAYQFDHPYVLDSTHSQAVLGQQPTPLADGIDATLAWWRARADALAVA
jgi:nucleoside-diphosphate-sugar epimerase